MQYVCMQCILVSQNSEFQLHFLEHSDEQQIHIDSQ